MTLSGLAKARSAALPAEYNAALDRLVAIAFDNGKLQERQRIAMIVALAPNERLLLDAIKVALGSDVTPEQAAKYFADSADEHTRQSAQTISPSSYALH